MQRVALSRLNTLVQLSRQQRKTRHCALLYTPRCLTICAAVHDACRTNTRPAAARQSTAKTAAGGTGRKSVTKRAPVATQSRLARLAQPKRSRQTPTRVSTRDLGRRATPASIAAATKTKQSSNRSRSRSQSRSRGSSSTTRPASASRRAVPVQSKVNTGRNTYVLTSCVHFTSASSNADVLQRCTGVRGSQGRQLQPVRASARCHAAQAVP